MQSNPRPHADLIIAWANGAEIQYYSDSSRKWVDICNWRSPAWDVRLKYRIKPQQKRLKGKYRVYLWYSTLYGTIPYVHYDESTAEEDEKHEHFKGWLTDWIEYDVIDPNPDSN